jgi:hypothetical protein
MRYLVLLFALSSPAWADPEAVRTSETPEDPKRAYPMAVAERPVLLPPLMFEPQVGTGVTNIKDGGNGETFNFGLDVGVHKRLQLGFFFDFPVNPNADFGAWVAHAVIGVHRYVGVRVDVGTEQLKESVGGLFNVTKAGFVGGLGLPAKVRLARWVSFVSGPTSEAGFAPQTLSASADGRVSVYGSGTLLSNDLLTFYVADLDSLRAFYVSFFLSGGLLFQPHERIALGVRTGYRLTAVRIFGDNAPSTAPIIHYVPLSLDAVVTIIKPLDVGFSAFFAGYVAASNVNLSGATEPGWGDLRQFSFWVRGRI